MCKALDVRQLLPCQRLGLADDGVGRGDDLDVVLGAPVLEGTTLDVGAYLPAGVDLPEHGEHGLGPARGELASPVALPGLHDDRVALRRARDCQGAARSEPLALVVQPVDAVRVGEHALTLVEPYRPVVPAVPQAGDDLHHLVGLVVAPVVLSVDVHAEVLGFGVVKGGDDVPGGAPVGEVIDGREEPRDVERRVVGRRVCRADAQVAGRERHCHHHRDEVELYGADAQTDGVVHRVVVATGHGEPVVDEAEVEFAGLKSAGDLLVEACGEEPGVGRWMPP